MDGILWYKYRIKNSVQDVEQKATIGTKNPRSLTQDKQKGTDDDYLEKHFAKQSCDMKFYDFPAYWKNNDIYEMLKKVGYIERLEVKWNYKYRTVRARIRLTKEMEEIFLKGGSNNIALTKK
ncbi:hypothetical protein RhiirC2_782342 [Rhizophagus irregularis]|uniref:Uncharacterized protein n=1 Tax=Rhizophagus irregularis TaxID=588596 RepID=A0A2N1N3E9_9GLOM|nr:hypothetical protein RhiirC2_782342 [Rhizophagus irregularis]